MYPYAYSYVGTRRRRADRREKDSGVKDGRVGVGPVEPALGDVAVGGLGEVGAVLVLVEAATRRRTPMLSFVGNYSQPHDNQTSAAEEAMVAGAGDPEQLDQLLLLDPYAEDDITNTMPTRCSTLIPTPTPTFVIKATASATSAKPAASTCSLASAAQGVNDCGGGGGRLHRVPRCLPRPCEVPDRGLLCNLLCSIPLSMEGRGWADNQDCGVSCTFGTNIVADFLRAHDMDLGRIRVLRRSPTRHCIPHHQLLRRVPYCYHHDHLLHHHQAEDGQ